MQPPLSFKTGAYDAARSTVLAQTPCRWPPPRVRAAAGPMPGTQARACGGALEASRGALMAAHAAGGLAASHSREGVRLLRAAEGLLRAAVAVLSSPMAAPAPEPAKESEAPRRRRRPRGRGKAGAAVPPVGELGGGGGAAERPMVGLAATSEAPAGEASGGRHDAMSEEDPFDDSWADGLRRAPAPVDAAAAVGGREEQLAALQRRSAMLAARLGTPHGNLLSLLEAASAVQDSLSPAELDIFVDVQEFALAGFRRLQSAAGSAADTGAG